MVEHQLECERNSNFIEAELARQRVNQLEAIKVKKEYKTAKNSQNMEKYNLLLKQRTEIENFNDEQDKELAKLMISFENQKKLQNEEHNKQLKKLIEEQEKKKNNMFKFSNDVLEARKVLEYFVKKKE